MVMVRGLQEAVETVTASLPWGVILARGTERGVSGECGHKQRSPLLRMRRWCQNTKRQPARTTRHKRKTDGVQNLVVMMSFAMVDIYGKTERPGRSGDHGIPPQGPT